MQPVEVRTKLVEALELDLVGPAEREPESLGELSERLPQAPSRWYLTGFLVPAGAGPEQLADPSSDEDLDETPRTAGIDEDTTREPASARQRRLPTSMGVSVLLPAEARQIEVRVRWGDYVLESPDIWQRLPRTATLTLSIDKDLAQPEEYSVKGSNGLQVALLVRHVGTSYAKAGVPPGVRTVSIFLVNRRQSAQDSRRDEAFAFQTELESKAIYLSCPDRTSEGSSVKSGTTG